MSEPSTMRTVSGAPDHDVQVARVRQFVIGDISAAVAGLVLLTVFYAVWRPAWVLPVQGSVVVAISALFYALVLLRQQRLTAAVVAIAASFWFVIPTITFILPTAFVACSLGTVWPVLLSTPYVDGPMLARLSMVTAPITVLSIALSFRADPYGVEDTLGTTVMNISLIGIGTVFIGLTLLMIWAYNSRLQETLDGLARTNEELAGSERTLERKVETRTHELATATAYLTAVIDGLGQGLLTLDMHGQVQQTNEALAAMFTGRFATIDDVPPDLRSVIDGARELTEHDAQAGFVTLADDRMGKATATPISADGQTVGTVVIVDDVTREREVDRMKTDFISTVSHELRTPLTSVLGFTKIIQRRLEDRVYPHADRSDPKVDKAIGQVDDNLEIILSEGERLTSLINTVLDISKMEAGEVEWADESVDIDEVIDTAIRATAGLFTGEDVTVHVEVEPGLPPVRGDRERLVQVMVNLLSNAQKFTDHGSVEVRAALDGDAIQIDVADTGIGVAAADLPDLFERFRQVGENLTDRPVGTGLGLPICREIVEHHGGMIDATSQLGSGTTFTVRLPSEATTGDAWATLAEGDVLVVDDDPSIRTLLRDIFVGAGYSVSVAVDGNDALRMAATARPSLITLDLLMPGLSGIETAVALRQQPALTDVPLMVISVLDERESAPAHADAHLTKPIDHDLLVATAAELMTSPDVVVLGASSDVIDAVTDTLTHHGYETAGNDGEHPIRFRRAKRGNEESDA
ncbi:MAG: ATP-binding protein [Actinomycetota bacterium]